MSGAAPRAGGSRLVLDVRGLGVRRAGRRVVDGVDLALAPGELAALVGPNGAGKSTLLAAVAGALAPDRGAVLVDGASMWGPAREGRRARAALGYVPEAADPPAHLTGAEAVALATAVKGAPPLDDDQRARLGLAGFAATRIDRMSLGQRRRTCLAAALVGPPSLLVLDEPDNGLDPGGVEILMSILREATARGAAVLIASHDDGLLEKLRARRVSLDGGRVVDPSGSA